MVDISFKSDNKKFNYRVCAMMISNGKILAMHDERSPYFYLPGGRVAIGETAESAVIREVKEELGVTPKIVRPLWLNQAFFTEDVDNLHYHELCIYFLMDISNTDLLNRGEKFISNDLIKNVKYLLEFNGESFVLLNQITANEVLEKKIKHVIDENMQKNIIYRIKTILMITCSNRENIPL